MLFRSVIIAMVAAPPMVASVDSVRSRKQKVVTSAIPSINRGYTPTASNIVPPEIPGTKLARPISKIGRASCRERV